MSDAPQPARFRRALHERLASLYRLELEQLDRKNGSVTRDDSYWVSHAHPNSIRRQVDIFLRYVAYIDPRATVLDWGCSHAPDACLLREFYGQSIVLHGCDFQPVGRFPVFHDFAALSYRQLTDPVRLPYEDATFDAVVSSGAIEHAAADLESLKELRRILKDDGTLIITFAPNQSSYSEFLARFLKLQSHTRLYKKSELIWLLKHYGFLPQVSGYHQFLPAQRSQRLLGRLWPLNRGLERIWPLNVFCANIYVVSIKKTQM
jgi:SAM-dependent methyltransferase